MSNASKKVEEAPRPGSECHICGKVCRSPLDLKRHQEVRESGQDNHIHYIFNTSLLIYIMHIAGDYIEARSFGEENRL